MTDTSEVAAADALKDQQPTTLAFKATADALEDEGFILLTELRPIIPLHPQHVRKLVKRGLFPAPVNLAGRTAFRRRDIRDWARRQS